MRTKLIGLILVLVCWGLAQAANNADAQRSAGGNALFIPLVKDDWNDINRGWSNTVTNTFDWRTGERAAETESLATRSSPQGKPRATAPAKAKRAAPIDSTVWLGPLPESRVVGFLVLGGLAVTLALGVLVVGRRIRTRHARSAAVLTANLIQHQLRGAVFASALPRKELQKTRRAA